MNPRHPTKQLVTLAVCLTWAGIALAVTPDKPSASTVFGLATLPENRVDTISDPIALLRLVDKLEIPKKGELETTREFERRAGEYYGNVSVGGYKRGTMFAIKAQLSHGKEFGSDPGSVTYDADSGELTARCGAIIEMRDYKESDSGLVVVPMIEESQSESQARLSAESQPL